MGYSFHNPIQITELNNVIVGVVILVVEEVFKDDGEPWAVESIVIDKAEEEIEVLPAESVAVAVNE